MQTKSAYLNPLTLLELYWAERSNTPIICVRLQGDDYDFNLVARLLGDLKGTLERELHAVDQVMEGPIHGSEGPSHVSEGPSQAWSVGSC